MTPRYRTKLLLISALLLTVDACLLDPKPVGSVDDGDLAGDGDGDADSTGEGDGDSGDGDSTGDGDQTGDGDGDSGTGDGDGDPTGDGDGDPTGDGDGDGDSEPVIIAACTAACEVYNACVEGIPDCMDACVSHHLEYFFEDIECLGLELELTECIAGLTCDELNQFMNEDPETFPCQEEFEATCEVPIGECSVGTGNGDNPGECSVDILCDGEPALGLECDGETCTCFVDGVEVGGCSDALGVCGEPGPSAYDECCPLWP